MPAVARLGDTSTHGGAIISASSDVMANGRGVARQGDILQCPQHGPRPINAISKNNANSRKLITVGATATCGAVITTGSPNVTSA